MEWSGFFGDSKGEVDGDGEVDERERGGDSCYYVPYMARSVRSMRDGAMLWCDVQYCTCTRHTVRMLNCVWCLVAVVSCVKPSIMAPKLYVYVYCVGRRDNQRGW